MKSIIKIREPHGKKCKGGFTKKERSNYWKDLFKHKTNEANALYRQRNFLIDENNRLMAKLLAIGDSNILDDIRSANKKASEAEHSEANND